MVIVKTYKLLETNTGVQMPRDPRHHSSASKVKMGFFVSHGWNNKLQRQYASVHGVVTLLQSREQEHATSSLDATYAV